MGIARKHLGIAPAATSAPGHYSLGVPGLLESKFAAAGFEDISAQPVATELRASSANEFVSLLRGANAGPALLLEHLDEPERDAIWAEIADALRIYKRKDDWVIPAEFLIVTGRRPEPALIAMAT